MTRVLHLVTHLTRGGIESWLLNMLAGIPRQECVQDVCAKGSSLGPRAGEARAAGATLYHCPMGPAHLPFGRRLREILISGRYDILHNHLEVYSGYPVRVARSCGTTVITSFHNTHFEPQEAWARKPVLGQLRTLYRRASIAYALRRSDLVTGCSQRVLDELDPNGRLARQARSRVLYYGVAEPEPPAEAARSEFRASLGLDENARLVLHVGRFLPQKNHAGLLRIFAEIRRFVPDARLLLVGDGPLRLSMEALAAREGLTPFVRFLGVRDDVPAFMACSDVFLFPSRYEGFGLVILEANAAGLPVVAARVAGISEAVEENRTGLLYESGDAEGAARSVVRILTNPSLGIELSREGRRIVREKFSIPASARRLLQCYADVRAARQRSPAPLGDEKVTRCAF
ncbi:MAG: glycosyltransferase family 4 protein [Acidobacteria bacterium]|nr:glycosyltransferase family 4 protein [Acidobacteriota bacterium]